MKKSIFISIAVLFISIFLGITTVSAKEPQNIVVLKGTNETKDDMPVYEYMEDTKNFMDSYNKSFIKKSFELFWQANKYSKAKNAEMYIAFKKGSGCYGNTGFYFKKDGQLYDKTKSPYIELSTSFLENKIDYLDSITQILPHEMGHVIYGITKGESKENVIDMHNSNITTSYSLAFNEGFAEHFQVISKLYEENEQIKEGIYKDIHKREDKLKNILNSAKRDFILPLRLDYYRETSMLWQNQFEGLKRQELAAGEAGKYKNSTFDFKDSEKTILYRNIGFSQDKDKKRTLEQSLSTEVVISNFFIKLITTYNENFNEKYDKIFKVFSKYLTDDKNSELIQFVNGYVKEYPDDKKRVLSAFKESTGYDFVEHICEEIWCISEEPHINFPMDQFGATKSPIYIFNLNTCEIEDLMKLNGLSKKDAETIISYRNSHNGFKELKDLGNIEGLSDAATKILTSSTDKNKIEQLKANINEKNFENRISKILSSSLKHLGLRAMIWFVVFFIGYYLLVLKNKKLNTFDHVKNIIKQLLKFIFYVMIGLIVVIVSGNIIIRNTYLNPILLFITFIFLIEGLKIIILMCKGWKTKIRESIISTSMMMGIVLYSLF